MMAGGGLPEGKQQPTGTSWWRWWAGHPAEPKSACGERAENGLSQRFTGAQLSAV